jgi:hypothetical protein
MKLASTAAVTSATSNRAEVKVAAAYPTNGGDLHVRNHAFRRESDAESGENENRAALAIDEGQSATTSHITSLVNEQADLPALTLGDERATPVQQPAVMSAMDDSERDQRDPRMRAAGEPATFRPEDYFLVPQQASSEETATRQRADSVENQPVVRVLPEPAPLTANEDDDRNSADWALATVRADSWSNAIAMETRTFEQGDTATVTVVAVAVPSGLPAATTPDVENALETPYSERPVEDVFEAEATVTAVTR